MSDTNNNERAIDNAEDLKNKLTESLGRVIN